MMFLRRVSQNLIFLLTIVRKRCVPKLVPIECRVARLVALDCTDQEISAILGRPIDKIRRYINRAMKKIGVTSKTSLAKWAVDNRISPPGDILSPAEHWAQRQM